MFNTVCSDPEVRKTELKHKPSKKWSYQQNNKIVECQYVLKLLLNPIKVYEKYYIDKSKKTALFRNSSSVVSSVS